MLVVNACGTCHCCLSEASMSPFSSACLSLSAPLSAAALVGMAVWVGTVVLCSYNLLNRALLSGTPKNPKMLNAHLSQTL